MAETVLAAAAATWGVVMGLSPVLQIRRMLAERSSRDVSVGYFVVLLVGFGLWIAYGAVAGVPALVLPNAVAVCVTVATIGVALRLRRVTHAPEDAVTENPAEGNPVAVRSRR